MADICEKSGKVKHNRTKANKHLSHIRRSNPKYHGIVYRCPYCDNWHVGRDKRDQKKGALVLV